MRNHGRSDYAPSKLTTFGSEEHLDVLAAWQWVQDTHGFPADKVGVYGNSMSGAAATIAAGVEPLIKATWVDSPACDPEACFDQGIRNSNGGMMGKLLGPIVPLIVNMAFSEFDSK